MTAEAKNDLQKVLYQAVFKGGSQQLEEMFDKLPAKAQRAILATAFRDMDSPFAGKLLPEIQSSIVAYNVLMGDPAFADAKNMEQALRAISAFKRVIALDDRFEQYTPADNFSNFALHLAGMYKAGDMSQSTMASYFNQMYDLAQGKKAATLFDEADTTKYPLAEVIKKVLNIEYKPAKNGNNNVANGGADVALRNQASSGGKPRGSESSASGEQASTGTEPAERGGGTSDDSRGDGTDGDLQPVEKRTEGEVDEHGKPFVKAEDGTTVFGEITEDSGLPAAPIKLSVGFQDNANKKGYGLAHIEANHGKQIRDAGFKSVEEFVSYVAKNYDPDNIRVGKKREDGNGTFLIQVLDSHENTLYIELSKDGSYWGVNSGGVFRKGYSNKKETVAKTEPQQPNNAVSSGSSLLIDEHSGISSIKPNGEPTASDGKDTNSASDKQGKGGETHLVGLENYTRKEIKEIVQIHVGQVLSDAGFDVDVDGIEIHGSRNRGDAREDSDLDVVIHYRGEEKEDGVFNALNEEPLEIDGIRVDINPIRDVETGSLDEYIKKSRAYDEEMKAKTVANAVKDAEAEVDTNPTDAQKVAGNYKKGHVKVGSFDISAENYTVHSIVAVYRNGNRYYDHKLSHIENARYFP